MSLAKPKKKSYVRARRSVRTDLLARLSRTFLVLSAIALFGVLIAFVGMSQRPRDASAVPTASSVPSKTAFVPTPTLPPPPSVALVAGHWGYDTGAVCPPPDNTREVDVTLDVARRAKTLLEARGYRVEILEEFDARLSKERRDYAPRAFLSIHADSCIYDVRGFKIARAANSAIPLEDDRLVRCVKSHYADATLLPYHADTITPNMLEYHGLQKIAPQTPGAILELGFLGSDGDLLKNKRALPAQGIADGVEAFLKGSGCQ